MKNVIKRKIKNILYRIRSLQYPPNPQTINFDLSDPHSLTEDGQQFLILDEMEDQERILIFSSNAQKRIMLQSECLHTDGKACPDLFNQLYIIHAYHRGESPVCYALMQACPIGNLCGPQSLAPGHILIIIF